MIVGFITERVLAVSEEHWPGYRDAYTAALARTNAPAAATALDARRDVRTPKGVAVVPLMGALSRRGNWVTEFMGWATYEGLAEQMRTLAADPEVGSIVLRVDSPGGTVHGVEEAALAVADAAKRKPVIAVADGLMASAAYWIASQATEVVATPGSEVGSIGVIGVHLDQTKALEQAGITATVFTAGAHKGEGHPLVPLSDADRSSIQARLDAQYGLFTARVARGRKVSVDDVRTGFGEGRVLPASAAVKAGLVDRVARLTDVIDATLSAPASPSSRASADADLRLKARLLAHCG